MGRVHTLGSRTRDSSANVKETALDTRAACAHLQVRTRRHPRPRPRACPRIRARQNAILAHTIHGRCPRTGRHLLKAASCFAGVDVRCLQEVLLTVLRGSFLRTLDAGLPQACARSCLDVVACLQNTFDQADSVLQEDELISVKFARRRSQQKQKLECFCCCRTGM